MGWKARGLYFDDPHMPDVRTYEVRFEQPMQLASLQVWNPSPGGLLNQIRVGHEAVNVLPMPLRLCRAWLTFREFAELGTLHHPRGAIAFELTRIADVHIDRLRSAGAPLIAAKVKAGELVELQVVGAVTALALFGWEDG